MATKILVGDQVYRESDPGYGRIEAIKYSAFARIRWSNNWLEMDVPVRELVKVPHQRSIHAASRCKPAPSR